MDTRVKPAHDGVEDGCGGAEFLPQEPPSPQLGHNPIQPFVVAFKWHVRHLLAGEGEADLEFWVQRRDGAVIKALAIADGCLGTAAAVSLTFDAQGNVVNLGANNNLWFCADSRH